MDITVADPLVGTLVDGRYRVRARVARGGMATVYTALDERLERTVAMKIIHPGQAHDARFLERFRDEAKTIARLTHPNVVAVYDQGSHQGVPYLVMEYVRGRTLREVLTERRRLSPQEALAILEQMLAAVAAAHRAGLVHRDIKPENVLVAEAPGAGANSLVDGVVKVADFGLARAVEASVDDAGGQQLLATAAYVAPELITQGHADPRTDVYSAGVVLFEMLTGRVPYEGDRPIEVAWQHVDRDVPPPSRYAPGVPPVVDDLVARATRRDPGGRPTDAGALLAEVQNVREDVGFAVASRINPTAAPTVVVPRVEPQRPSWARLPSARPATYTAQPGRRRASTGAGAGTGPLDRFVEAKNRLLANPRGRVGLAAAIVVFGLLAAVGGWWFGIGRYTTTPGLVNVTKAQATSTAKQHGFTVKIDGRYDEKIPKDTVMGQQPAPGQRIVSGGEIVLTVSLGPERYAVPDVVGKAYELAAQDVTRLHLVPQRDEAYSDVVPAGSIVETDPAAGTPLPPNSPVKLKVSKGRSPLTMPNLVGADVNAATDQLRKLGLKVNVTQKDDDRPKDQVIAQDPVDGTGMQKGDTVTLTVSNGPAVPPPGTDVEVPEVTGLNDEDAVKTLQQAGFQAQLVGRGRIRLQNPPAHAQAPAGTTVVIWAFG
jgi:serine/threonine-protein kinase